MPASFINEEYLKLIDNRTFILDSSSPGGIDYDYACREGYNYKVAHGIPSIKAPKSISKCIKEIILKQL